MNNTDCRGLTVGGIVLTLVTLIAPIRANADAPKSARSEIEAALRAFTAAMSRGESVETVTKMLYADDVLISEPEESVRGMTATLKAMQEWESSLGPGGVKACDYKVIDPVVSSKTTFASFLNMTCKSNGVTTKQDMKLRLMYVWEKRAEGWRVVLESVHEGAF